MSEQTVEERLEALGIVLPSASEPAAKYANYVIANRTQGNRKTKTSHPQRNGPFYA